MLKRSVLFALVFAVIVAGLASVPARAGRQQPASVPADMVLLNGKIVTVETAQPEAQAIAITGDKIAA
ncbi:MAG TPA: hypothetical protein VFS23_06735, partial [Vicinamibacterales bacterium]|nr:hypothetical protein [Vicinamibacterales bacterium]